MDEYKIYHVIINSMKTSKVGWGIESESLCVCVCVCVCAILDIGHLGRNFLKKTGVNWNDNICKGLRKSDCV